MFPVKYIIILVLVFSSINTYSQNIIDLVLKLSENRHIHIDSTLIRQGLSRYYDSTYVNPIKTFSDFYFTKIDTKNGYVSATRIDGESSEYEICYWNMSNGNKLIAVESYQCATICYSEWKFFEYSKERGIEVCKREILPNPIINEEDIFDFVLMKKEYPKEFEWLYKESGFSYNMKLPEKGKNIIVYFEPHDDDISIGNKLRYREGRKGIELIWMDGYFKAGNWISE
jgi:hypothetical protein